MDVDFQKMTFVCLTELWLEHCNIRNVSVINKMSSLNVLSLYYIDIEDYEENDEEEHQELINCAQLVVLNITGDCFRWYVCNYSSVKTVWICNSDESGSLVDIPKVECLKQFSLFPAVAYSRSV
jgi:hypothetical protein